jgi:hypothetical protein
MLKTTLLDEVMRTLSYSLEDISRNITDVSYGPTENNQIYITLNGVYLVGFLRDRNSDLFLTGDKNKDKRIALRVILDGDFEYRLTEAVSDKYIY